MAIWNLLEIRRKVRQVTGRYSPQELTNDRLDDYINQYYQYTFPAELKLERFHTFFDFLTVANQQNYDAPTGFVNFEPPAYVDFLNLLWYQNPEDFYANNPVKIARTMIGVGNGIVTTFISGGQTNQPVLPGSAVITDNNEVFEDTNTVWTTVDVALVGSLGGSGTINYVTGVVNITFNTAPIVDAPIWYSNIQFLAGTPTAVLWYNNQFQFFPVPNTAYRFRVKAYADTLVLKADGTTLPMFENSTDRPLYDQWGPTIAYGASRDIHSDFGETDAYQRVTALYKEQLAYALRRTNQNLLNTRAGPHF